MLQGGKESVIQGGASQWEEPWLHSVLEIIGESGVEGQKYDPTTQNHQLRVLSA